MAYKYQMLLFLFWAPWQLVTIEIILLPENSDEACYLTRPPHLITLDLPQRYSKAPNHQW